MASTRATTPSSFQPRTIRRAPQRRDRACTGGNNSDRLHCSRSGRQCRQASIVGDGRPVRDALIVPEDDLPITHYGVLKGQAVDIHLERGAETPHYQIHVLAQGTNYRCAVNVQSGDRSSLLFVAEDQFIHPLTAELARLPAGFQQLPSGPGGLALDYIRGNLLDPRDMKVAPPNVSGPDNDLNDFVDHYVARAVADQTAEVYAFGQRWGPEPQTPDKIFTFRPGNGVHNMHMNQGNDAAHRGEDGVWQDGGLLIHFPTQSRWVAIFLAFQSQAWHTDDRTGHALVGPAPEPDGTEFSVHIVAALVNPVGPAPEHESVTVLNVSPNAADLTGWSIADRAKRKHQLQGTLAAGATLQVALPPEVQLGNSGGLITLLNKDGLKVHGVSYTAAQAQREGWTIAF
jgi:uncharacterized protein YukJ